MKTPALASFTLVAITMLPGPGSLPAAPPAPAPAPRFTPSYSPPAPSARRGLLDPPRPSNPAPARSESTIRESRSEATKRALSESRARADADVEAARQQNQRLRESMEKSTREIQERYRTTKEKSDQIRSRNAGGASPGAPKNEGKWTNSPYHPLPIYEDVYDNGHAYADGNPRIVGKRLVVRDADSGPTTRAASEAESRAEAEAEAARQKIAEARAYSEKITQENRQRAREDLVKSDQLWNRYEKPVYADSARNLMDATRAARANDSMPPVYANSLGLILEAMRESKAVGNTGTASNPAAPASIRAKLGDRLDPRQDRFIDENSIPFYGVDKDGFRIETPPATIYGKDKDGFLIEKPPLKTYGVDKDGFVIETPPIKAGSEAPAPPAKPNKDGFN